MKFKIGDYVRWTTKFHNVIVKKQGRIIYIIDSFTKLNDVINNEEFKLNIGKNTHLIYNDLNDSKPYESYLVITGKREGQIPNLHWPEVESLKKIRKRKTKFKIIIEDKKNG